MPEPTVRLASNGFAQKYTMQCSSRFPKDNTMNRHSCSTETRANAAAAQEKWCAEGIPHRAKGTERLQITTRRKPQKHKVRSSTLFSKTKRQIGESGENTSNFTTLTLPHKTSHAFPHTSATRDRHHIGPDICFSWQLPCFKQLARIQTQARSIR